MSSTDGSRFLFPLLVLPLPDGVFNGDSPIELFKETLAESGVHGALFGIDSSSVLLVRLYLLGEALDVRF